MRILGIFTLLCLLTATALSIYSFYVYRAPFVAADTNVLVERGTGARGTLAQLERERVLPAPWKIMLPFILSGQHRSLKAGEYAFAAGMSPQQVVASLAQGDVVVHALTILEGWSVVEARAALVKEPLLTGELPADIAEGSLSPDTVHFARGDTRASIVERLQEQQRKRLNEAWVGRDEDLPLATPADALVLASIIEEETGVADERATVAGVYINRLRIGMPLQADPTVAYGVAPEGMKRSLSRADLKRDTAYNTYTRSGLPPTPISNPGAASINAAVHPAPTKALFFVATGNGGHWFAATDAEHQRNVAKYRAALRAQR